MISPFSVKEWSDEVVKSFLFDLLEENKKLKKQVSSLNKCFEDLKGSCERDREDVWKIVSELCDKLNK